MTHFSEKKPLFLLIFWLIIQSPKTSGQSIWKGWQLETTLNSGHITRHTPKLTIDNSQRVWGEELNFNYQTWGKKDWNSWQHFPQLGCAFIYFKLGDGAHGRSIGLMPNLGIPAFSIKGIDFIFRLGTGLVNISRPFDYQKNPSQNAIGSKWNDVTQVRFGGIWQAKGGRFVAGGGGSFTHFSNGGAHRPNYGLNIPAFFLTSAWVPVLVKKADYKVSQEQKKETVHKWGGLFQTGLAIGEIQVEDGPVHPIYSASISATYSFNKVNRGSGGLDWEHHSSIQYFLAHAGNQLNENLSYPKASRWMLFLGDEFLFGDIGLNLQAGVYLGGEAELIPLLIYNKLSIRYYFPKIKTIGFRAWIGLSLKSHKITAEYISINTGIDF